VASPSGVPSLASPVADTVMVSLRSTYLTHQGWSFSFWMYVERFTVLLPEEMLTPSFCPSATSTPFIWMR